MKSPLVEALRQANGTTETTDTEVSETTGNETLPPGNESRPEPGQEPRELQSPKSLEILPIDGQPEPTDSQEPGLDEGLSLQVANDDESREDAAGDSPLAETVIVPVITQPSRSPRLSLFAPLICLGIALASGAAHFAYQWLGGRHQNNDLELISSAPSSGSRMLPDDVALPPPSRFKLVTGEQAASGNTGWNDEGRAGTPGPGSDAR